MVKIFTTSSCSSCKKAIKWLDEHKIKYSEKNLFTEPITRDDIKLMLENSENGFEDIISTRSKVFTTQNVDIDSMSYNELIDFIIKNPSILRRPIIVDDAKMQVGYNDDEIRVFIPREIRKITFCMGCTNTEECEYQRLVKEHLQTECKKA